MKDVRIIKRYQNRKLYDTHQSCYVTLEEIAQIIRDGHEIQVIDNKTKSDITYNTQIQLLFDQERKSNRQGDTELLKRVIRADEGTLSGYIRNLEIQLNLGHTYAPEAPVTTENTSFDQNMSFLQAQNLTSGIETSATLN